jgi:hypothetical protein
MTAVYVRRVLRLLRRERERGLDRDRDRGRERVNRRGRLPPPYLNSSLLVLNRAWKVETFFIVTGLHGSTARSAGVGGRGLRDSSKSSLKVFGNVL